MSFTSFRNAIYITFEMGRFADTDFYSNVNYSAQRTFRSSKRHLVYDSDEFDHGLSVLDRDAASFRTTVTPSHPQGPSSQTSKTPACWILTGRAPVGSRKTEDDKRSSWESARL
ncbi:uncharacterized protein STEHIDRAFT_111669 [Stereum hirsutum FP-91666 SS1]|uniref:uncharacterized protein n=1 Tax=Stereum hirsutum (strain FP-91666) TaxID=721885 RepID=UPI00044492B3|nr:uncharacterized protein STEHIDRAFT_111669 [Stereum hirsutum FP-91666 SS1]EIM86140.1 hypothetical protein STEHIDRAFT_111669 [Stereum hirsutum FP-91666 SS1]